MKKKIVVALLAALMVGGVMAGCGSNADTEPAADSTVAASEVASSEDASSEAEASEAEEIGFTLEDYVNSSDWQDQQKEMNESLKAQGMSIEMTAVKNDLTMTMNFLTQMPITDEVKEQLQSEEFMGQFEKLIKEELIPGMEKMDSAGLKDPTVTIRLINADGSEIFAQTISLD